MIIVWKDTPAEVPEVPEGSRLVTVTGDPGEGSDLRTQFLDATRKLGATLVADGASPAQIRTMEIHVPDTDAVLADLSTIDLLYREALAGTFGKVALLQGTEVFLRAHAIVPPPSDGPVFGNYDAAALNIQYSPRMTIPDMPALLATWREEGSAHQPSRTAELMYGEGDKNRIDLFMPPGANQPPIHAFIHGGYWQALDKRDNGQLSQALVRAGIAVACINYTLAPPATVAQIVDECRNALRTLWNSASDYGYDASRLTVSGHSAGGHLAAMMAATDWTGIDASLPEDFIKGTVPISGLFDLEPLRFTGINTALELTAETAKSSSPIHLSSASNGPIVAAVGGAESDEFRRQSKDFVENWNAKGADITYLEVDGKHHLSVVEALNDEASPLYKTVVEIATNA